MVEGFCRRVRRIASDAVLSFHASFAAEAEGTTPSRFFPLSPSFFCVWRAWGGFGSVPGEKTYVMDVDEKNGFSLTTTRLTVHIEE